MIENKPEVILPLDMSKDDFSEESNFLDFINNKKDKKNGHGEDASIKMIDFFPELYSSHINSAGLSSLFIRRESNARCHNVIKNNIMSYQQRKYFYSEPILLTKENDLSPNGGITLKKTDTVSLECVSRNNAESLNDADGKDCNESNKESNKEVAKNHFPHIQLRNDMLSHRQQLARQDIQSRKLQSPVTDNLSKTQIDVTKNTAPIKNKSLNLDYPFLRWSGEHSVKVSIPMEQNPSRYLRLLPSDQRSAEVLARQVSQLSGFTTELLNPRREDEEHEKRDTQYKEEEERE